VKKTLIICALTVLMLAMCLQGCSKKPTHVHSYTETVSLEPTCISNGVSICACSCGDSYIKELAKVPHVPAEETVIKEEPTCTRDGLMIRMCTVCNQPAESRPISKLGHNYSNGICTVCRAYDPSTPNGSGLVDGEWSPIF